MNGSLSHRRSGSNAVLARRFWAILSLLVSGLSLSISGPPQVQAAETVSFTQHVRPLLAKRCFSCHGPDNAESGLALHSQDSALAVTDSGLFAISPGNPEQSELLRRVTAHDEDERMPPEGEPLSEREVNLLKAWIEQGAEYTKHWAFVPPAEVTIPAVQNQDWVANPIDAFVLRKLEDAGLQPNQPAERHVLVRRLYYDVTGLPPTPAELAKHLKDRRPESYRQLVDRLLASPRYGEKWARHWLDVVRYAESNSFERDAPKPYAWTYRDYVIQSLNEDKPYDQFVREQLAGDELDLVTADSMAATGYYRLGTWDDEPADELQARYDDLDNILSTTSQAFLGLTIGCARCHDHKIDPIPQTDYYGLLAFFADVTPYARPRGENSRDPKEYSLWDLASPQHRDVRVSLAAEANRIKSDKRAMEQSAIELMDDIDQRRTETRERRAVLAEKLHLFMNDREYQKYRGLLRDLKRTKQKLADLPPPEWVMALAKCDPRPAPMHVMMRGNAHAPGDQVSPHFPELFGSPLPSIEAAAANARSSGRRRLLADWITQPDNHLANRVIVNRVWQHHFGRGIVRTPNNFGQLGTPPTHPQLLDWLANWFVEHDWSLKALHRLILNSNTYRMSSKATPAALAADPANDLFWRFDMRRLTAEEIRDSVLYVSGQLNEKLYGPSVYPKLSAEVLATQSRPGENWPTSKPHDAARRSIYIHVKRSLIPPELASFDFPETDTSCEARFNTTQAAQALNMLHSELMQTQAAALARRAQREAGDGLVPQVEYTLTLALQRDPDKHLVDDCLALIGRYRAEHRLTEREALEQFCLMVYNLNEFIYLD